MVYIKEKRTISCLIIVSMLIAVAWKLFSIKQAWNDIDFKLTEKILSLHEYLKIPERKKIQDLSGKNINRSIFILFLEGNIKAIFKPNRQLNAIKSAYMAYQLSQFMRLRLVPPTVIRTINGDTGIVQLFVDSVTAKEISHLENLTALKKSQIYIFNFILGEHNPHKGNFLFGKKCKAPALIDNEFVFWPAYFKYGDYPFVSYSKSMKHVSSGSFMAHKVFPKDKIMSLKAQSIFSSKALSSYEKNIIEGHFDWFYSAKELTDGFLYFARSKDIFWIKKNFIAYAYMYKQFLPLLVSKKIVKQLKKLNYNNLAFLIEPFDVQKGIILGILHRRDIVLEKISKCSAGFKQFDCRKKHKSATFRQGRLH